MPSYLYIAPRFGHVCPFSGDSFIDERDWRFTQCRCFRPSAEVLREQDRLAVQLDAERGPAAGKKP